MSFTILSCPLFVADLALIFKEEILNICFYINNVLLGLIATTDWHCICRTFTIRALYIMQVGNSRIRLRKFIHKGLLCLLVLLICAKVRLQNQRLIFILRIERSINTVFPTGMNELFLICRHEQIITTEFTEAHTYFFFSFYFQF